MLLKSIGISLIRPDLGEDERENKLSGRPERFIQSRFQAYPISGATQEFAPPILIRRAWNRDGPDAYPTA